MHSCTVQVENAETIKRMHRFGPISALCARQRSAFSSSSDRPPWPWQLSAAFQIQNFFSIFQTISGSQYLSDSFSLHFSIFFVVFCIFLPRCFKEAFLGGRASQAVVVFTVEIQSDEPLQSSWIIPILFRNSWAGMISLWTMMDCSCVTRMRLPSLLCDRWGLNLQKDCRLVASSLTTQRRSDCVICVMEHKQWSGTRRHYASLCSLDFLHAVYLYWIVSHVSHVCSGMSTRARAH